MNNSRVKLKISSAKVFAVLLILFSCVWQTLSGVAFAVEAGQCSDLATEEAKLVCLEKVYGEYNLYFLSPVDQNRECATGVGTTPSTDLPDGIPEPHRSVFAAAAAKYNVNPQYIAALFLTEQGNTWKPLNGPWASSPAGASGPFQFMPATWGQYGVDGDNDGSVNIQDFDDAAASAANYIANGFKTNAQTPLGTIEKPFTPGTFLLASAQYNWGDGNVSKKTNSDSPLSIAPTETENYVKNIYTLITSGFTQSGHANYPNPTAVGQEGAEGASATTATDCSVQSGTSAAQVIQIAQQELSKNPVEYDENVDKYTDGNDEAWCADFVSWVFKEANAPFTGGLSDGWRIASVTSMKAWFEENATYFAVGEQAPRPGDVAIYLGAETPDVGSTRHVNIVIAVNGDTMTTIGGNESNRVTQSERKIELGAQGLIGFGRR